MRRRGEEDGEQARSFVPPGSSFAKSVTDFRRLEAGGCASNTPSCKGCRLRRRRLTHTRDRTDFKRESEWPRMNWDFPLLDSAVHADARGAAKAQIGAATRNRTCNVLG